MRSVLLPGSRRFLARPLLFANLFLALAQLGFAAQAASPAAVRARGSMVVSASPSASRAGIDVLRAGGNAIDATIATAFALTVTLPEAACVGGGGFLLQRSADGQVAALDFRETAPASLRPELFLGPDGRPVAERSLAGGLSVGVPGSVAGLKEAHRRWGTRPWAELMRPAIRLAAKGFPLSAQDARALSEEAPRLGKDPEARRIFFRAETPLREGERLVQRDLAASLRKLASVGADAFYGGPIGHAFVASVHEWGGVIEARDLTSYRPVAREPLLGSYRGHRLVAFPPPSSGGVVLFQILGMLEGFDVRGSGYGSSRTVHQIAEAERRAFADRARWLGDPAFFTVPMSRLLDPAYLADRSATIAPDRATPSTEIAAGALVSEGVNTTHVSVADAEGNVVALSVTLNSSFGCARIVPGTGILVNNEIDDFALASGAPNQFGLVGGEANAVAGGKRPLSSMRPLVVDQRDGGARPLLVLGSPGGSTIITSVLQVLMNVIDHGMELQAAVDAPRFHHQWLPDRIDHEPLAFPADVADALRRRGHELKLRERIGNLSAIGLARDGAWLGAADSRRGGLAAGD